MLNPEIVPIGVFVNEKTDVILRIVRESGIRMVQLHGQENGEIIHTIQSKAQVPVIKAVSVRSKEDVRSAVLSPADYLLFDCGEGGTGQTFDWNLLEDIPRSYFMAGGIGTHNMEEVLRRFSPFALDVNSSVETDGQKDGKKNFGGSSDASDAGRIREDRRKEETEMSKGRFGAHGGQYIPETLMNAVIELEEAYYYYKGEAEFQRELTDF